jgi:hypothetical protein
MFDGVALEAKCRYCPIRDSIIGLCREHAANVETKVKSLESVDGVRTAVFHPTAETPVCHIGAEATVVAIAPYAEVDHYSPVPIVVSPSDKTEKGDELAIWIQTVLDAWKAHENGDTQNGPIWALGSDGDSSFRRAKHIICMAKAVDPSTALGEKLKGMFGLNLYTSVDGVLGTCDPKHIIKRLSLLSRRNSKLTSGRYRLCNIAAKSPRNNDQYNKPSSIRYNSESHKATENGSKVSRKSFGSCRQAERTKGGVTRATSE